MSRGEKVREKGEKESEKFSMSRGEKVRQKEEKKKLLVFNSYTHPNGPTWFVYWVKR